MYWSPFKIYRNHTASSKHASAHHRKGRQGDQGHIIVAHTQAHARPPTLSFACKGSVMHTCQMRYWKCSMVSCEAIWDLVRRWWRSVSINSYTRYMSTYRPFSLEGGLIMSFKAMMFSCFSSRRSVISRRVRSASTVFSKALAAKQ